MCLCLCTYELYAYVYVFMYHMCACTHALRYVSIYPLYSFSEGKTVPLQTWTGPEISRKLRFPDFMTTAQDGVRLPVLRTGLLYPQVIFLVLISVRD